jgi:DNA-binding Lrp family transcriptional regulator
MQEAYVLINVESGTEEQVLNQLKPFIQEAYISYGVYDLVVKVKAETIDGIKDSVIRKIRTITNVKSTLTLIILQTINNDSLTVR